jgi:RNA polymerase sigma factor (sigma-70 family)
MPSNPPLAALVRRVAPELEAVTDAELLERFVRFADQAAFELLVWRHGAMVWGVCRRVLAPDWHAVEDACQATFVALASHAARLHDRRVLAAWLHRVAVRAALAIVATRGTKQSAADSPDPPDLTRDPVREANDREFQVLLDAGLNQLPDKLRIPFVLCELEGKSNAEAAAVLGCPVGTIESRLTRVRKRLRLWLTARGMVPAVAVGAGMVPESAWAAMATAGVPGAGNSAVRGLAAQAVPSVLSVKVRLFVAVGLLLGLCALGLGLTAGEQPAPPTDVPPAPVRADAPPVRAAQPKNEDPLPRGAVARLGSPRLRHPWVSDVCFAPDGKTIASVGDRILCVWDGETGKLRFSVPQPDRVFIRVVFADDGKEIVASGYPLDSLQENCTLHRWRIDATTGAVVEKWRSAVVRKGVSRVHFSADCTRVALLSAVFKEAPGGRGEYTGYKVVVIDTATDKTVWEKVFEKGADFVPNEAVFSPDGKWVAMHTYNNGAVRLFDGQTGRPNGSLTGKPGEPVAGFTSAAFSLDGSLLVAASTSGEVIVWERATGNVLRKEKLDGTNHTFAFTPDGKRLICSRAVNAVKDEVSLLDLAAGVGWEKGRVPFAEIGREYHGGGSTPPRFRSDGRVVAFGRGGGIYLFDTLTGKPVSPSAELPTFTFRELFFSADGKTLYAQQSAGWSAWDVAKGTRTQLARSGAGPMWVKGNATSDEQIAELLSPDGKFLARCVWTRHPFRNSGLSEDETPFEILDAKTRAVFHEYRGKQYWTAWHQFVPDGRAIIAGTHDGAVHVWGVDSGKDLVQIEAPAGVHSVHGVSSDSRVLVTVTRPSRPGGPRIERPLRVWDLKTGKELAQFALVEREPRAIGPLSEPAELTSSTVTAPDGQRVRLSYVAGALGDLFTVTVWDAAGAKSMVVPSVEWNRGLVQLSPDGRLVANCAWHGREVRVFELASGTERLVFRHESDVQGLAFAPDCQVLAASSLEAPILLWDLSGTLGRPQWSTAAADRGWDDLAALDAAKAFAPMCLLRANPDQALPFLKERVKLGPDAQTLKGLFADLGSDDFPKREKAQAALAGYGEVVGGALEAELKRTESPEIQARLTALLKKRKAPDVMTPDRLRLVRVVEVVEVIGTAEARALLKLWAASGVPVLGGEAQAALVRAR